jgi:hypothetical protein
MFPLSSFLRPRRAALVAKLAAPAVLAIMVAGCGGGTTQYEPFVPERLFSFGDENSVLTTAAPSGRNYGINGVNTNDTPDDISDDVVDCTLQPNWVQSLAGAYGFVFAECNPNNDPAPKARNWSAVGARVVEAEAQVDAQLAASAFRDKDIVSLMIGMNDIVELYGRYDGTNEAALVAEAGARGRRTAQLVNRLIALGAKVVVANIPDLGYTPYAVKENTAHPGSDRGGVLSRLSSSFNEQLGITILIDGRFVALAQIDQRILAINRSPSSWGIANTVDAACTTPPPACTNNTLIAGANPTTYLWSSDYWLSSRGQAQLAELAVYRALRNPF